MQLKTWPKLEHFHMLTTRYLESELGWYGVLGQTHRQRVKYFSFAPKEPRKMKENLQSEIKHGFP